MSVPTAFLRHGVSLSGWLLALWLMLPVGIHAQDLSSLRVKAELFSDRAFVEMRPTTARKQGSMCLPSPYQTIDGTCNNLGQINWGSTGRNHLRYNGLSPIWDYADGFNALAGPARKSPREISNLIFDQPASIPDPNGMSSMVFLFGQFLDHDITETAVSMDAAPIPVPLGDPHFDPMNTGTATIAFDRSEAAAGTGVLGTPREQFNHITPWIDGSAVYGSDPARAAWLRTGADGLLKTSTGNLLPYNTTDGESGSPIDPTAPEMAGDMGGMVTVFVAGDVRANENSALTSMHTMFVREHNRLATALKVANPAASDEDLYQGARKWLIASLQAIVFNEFLPAMGIQLDAYGGYNPAVSPELHNGFVTGAYRLGHTMVPDSLLMVDADCAPVGAGQVHLMEAFFNPSLVATHGIEPFLRGVLQQTQQKIDAKVTNVLRNLLFGAPGSPGLDLAALNIQRGRDHGLPTYNAYRTAFGLPVSGSASDFSYITTDATVQAQLAAAYNNDNTTIDLWVGLLTEDPMPAASVGPLLHAMLKDQFQALRNGDRFYFEVDPYFSDSDRTTIRQTRLSDLLRRNGTDLNHVQTDAFHACNCNANTTANLSLTKVVNDAMPAVGEPVIYTIFLSNFGPDAAQAVTVHDLLPSGLAYHSHTTSQGTYVPNTGLWNVDDLAHGASAVLTLTATVTGTGVIENCATASCPQNDPDISDNTSCATVNTEGSSGGGGAGVESQASEEMAVLFARRLFSRTMAQDESIAKRDAIELPALEASTVNSHVDGAGHLASVISALVPEQLQAASATGLVSTPTDLLGYTNATAVFAADYVRSDSRRAAALFATSTPAGQLYDHAKVICDRFGGGIYDELSLVSVAGHPFILAKMIQPSGEVDYAIEFVAYQMGNQFEVEHRFSWGEYTPRGSGEVMNFQIWGAVPAYTIALAEEVLANLGQLGQVSYQAEAAELPSVFVRTARYNQGQLTLELANRAGVSQARISGSYTRIENGGAELPMDQTISLPAGQIAEVTLETGSIFSATLEVSTAQSDARDRLYQADGPWSYASDANSPISGFQVHPQSFVIEGDYVIERSARLAGRVAEGGWASLFRYLKPDQGAFDASAYRALVLEARGTGEVELVFGQKSLSEGQAYRTRVSLSGSYQEHVIDFSQLSRPSGVTGGFVGSDLELLAFYPVGTGVFDIEVRSLRLSYAVPVSVEDVELPRAIVLDQNYPNPFNPVTQIRFGLPESSQVKLTVYDVLGRAVRVLADGRLSAGYHVVEFGGLELASGTYIYRLETPTKTLTQKMTLLK